jgi:pyruvate dehydrogenase E1 component beta subunit
VRLVGRDVTLVAWGAMVPIALQAAQTVAAEGIQAEVIDPRTLAPFDWDTLSASLDKTGRLVVVHEAPRTGGPGGALVAELVERCFWALRSPPRRVAGEDIVYPPQLLEDEYLPSVDAVCAALREVMVD